MIGRGRRPLSKADDFDNLSAIWILSCNDDNPIMTYRSISHRLNLAETVDVKALIEGRRELFRPGIMPSRMSRWKDLMKSGKSRPGWIAEIADEQCRLREVEALSPADVFRNQFRVEWDAPKCSIEVIDWGLRHIERLRKDWGEQSERKDRRVSAVLVPIGSLIFAALSVVVTGAVGWRSIDSQETLKHYEVSFKPREESYANFMDELMLAAISANARDENTTLEHITKMEAAFYRLEPFLSGSARAEAFHKFTEFNNVCGKMAKSSLSGDEYGRFVMQVAALKLYFRTGLYAALFDLLN